jgi:hypothetical protein
MIDNSYFISPDGVLMPVDSRHINTVMEYPEKFGLTKEYIDDIYKKYDEKFGLEGKAREEILVDLVHKNWIRIRLYNNKSRVFWSINILDFTPQVMKYLHEFAVKALAGTRPISKKAWGDDDVDVVSFLSGKAFSYKMKEMALPGFVSAGTDDHSEAMRKYQKGNDSPYEFSVYSNLKSLKVSTFKEYKVPLFFEFENESYIKEASLSTIERHTHNGFFCISAFRNEYSRKENIQRHKELCSLIKAQGLGYITLIGGYVENQGQPDQTEVKELSVLVPYLNRVILSYEKFFAIATSLRDRFQQDGILYCEADEVVREYKSSGEIISYGKFRVNNLAKYFSAVRGRKFEYFNASQGYRFDGFRYPSTLNDCRDIESLGGIIPLSIKEFKILKNSYK